MRRRAFSGFAGILLLFLSGCGGEALPGIQIGSSEGGSTFGLDSLPFRIQRANGSVLNGHASVRLLGISFFTRDATGYVVCSGSFALDLKHAPVPISLDCTGAGILHGTVTTAWADHGDGTFTESSGGTSTFHYGAPLSLPNGS
ncbi:hypothetical protein [Methylobacterium sp. J-092]|uniref:hypothetical protein n=1 Tax=Methylobacterium sp. J-092 TaxID=2836667 RepID=UPI001FBBD231|nr:hypothetical protein [Methylobacterium sp. J-092]MCJ2006763.1 hypothetical protein [Methylobacterium sp. J-092]